MTTIHDDVLADQMWAELVADLRRVEPSRRHVLRRVVAVLVGVAALGFAALAGYVAAPDREPAPDPVIVVCQERDPAACAEMPAVR